MLSQCEIVEAPDVGGEPDLAAVERAARKVPKLVQPPPQPPEPLSALLVLLQHLRRRVHDDLSVDPVRDHPVRGSNAFEQIG